MIRQEEQAWLLKDEIETVLAYLSADDGFLKLVSEPVKKAIRGIGDKSGKRHPWPLLPLIVCEAISGDYKSALPAAAALQFLKAAAEVFDDIEDADSSSSLATKYGNAIATNAATALLILAQKAISRLKFRGVEDSLIVRVMDSVNSFYTTACIGQHLDLSLTFNHSEEGMPDNINNHSEEGEARRDSLRMGEMTEEMYLKITDMKSASTVECACRVGALLATEDPWLIDKFSVFGHNLGMAAQIANDILGVTGGSDILKQKITLPVIYALSQTGGEAHKQLEAVFLRKTETEIDVTAIKDLLFSTGAIHYATVKMELFKQQARDILAEIESHGVSAGRLRPFLE